MISKALLSEVLKETIREVYKIGSNSNFKQNTLLFKLYGSGELCHINIYELAHKCKEWALKHHYKVISKPDNVPGLWEAYVNLSLTSKHGEVADTEPEAIFKACQWILTKDSK